MATWKNWQCGFFLLYLLLFKVFIIAYKAYTTAERIHTFLGQSYALYILIFSVLQDESRNEISKTKKRKINKRIEFEAEKNLSSSEEEVEQEADGDMAVILPPKTKETVKMIDEVHQCFNLPDRILKMYNRILKINSQHR